jgi:hypothetical protein
MNKARKNTRKLLGFKIFNNKAMKKNKNFKFYVNVEKENTSNIYDVSKKDMFYLEEDTILDIS